MLGIYNANYVIYTDVKYGTAERNVMDIYVPNNAAQNSENGCILYIHGGSWVSGHKENLADHCIASAKDGYIAVTMNYTFLNNGATASTVLDEIDSAIRKIKSFSDENGLNITKVATSGYSAGAHLSALYAYSRASDCPLKLEFTANRADPTEFSYETWGLSSAKYLSRVSSVEVAIEQIKNHEVDELMNTVSPIHYINSESVPTLLAHGSLDVTVPFGNVESIIKALNDSGVKYDFVLFPKSDHNLISDAKSKRLYNELLKEYCKTYFGY